VSETVAVCLPLTPAQLDKLRDAGLYPVETGGQNACPAAFRTARIAFGNPPADWIAQAPELQWIQLESVGFGEYLGLPPDGPLITNLAGFFSDPVAESALAGILALNRGIDRLVGLRTAGEWLGDDLRADLRLLRGARVVLFGMGAINRRLAELLKPFGCTISAFRSDWQPEELDAALAGADIVACAAPATSGTADLLDARRLSLLPPHALVVNFGRGSLLDETALAQALSGGRLRGAVIDVTRDEPLPPAHPFWKVPNLILTQHTGGGTGDEIDGKIGVFLANLARFRAGAPLQGVIDFDRGY
jgi:phosphoglycerate dehydrogenase-like enzyme